MAELTELFEFLSSPNPAARQIALQNLVGHTAKNDPQRHIFIPSSFAPLPGDNSGVKRKEGSDADDVKVKALNDLATLCRDQAQIAHDALSGLINLTDNLAVSRQLATEEFLVWLVSYTANTTSPLSPLTSMLLSNLTSHPSLVPMIAGLKVPIVPLPKAKQYPPYYLPACASGSSTIHPEFRDTGLGVAPNAEAGQEEERDVEAVRALVQAFEDGAGEGVKDSNGKRKGECHFLASVFANLSMVPVTRPLLLTPQPTFPAPSDSAASDDDEPLLSKIVVYTEHTDLIRRGGALGCIKNCAMDRASHPWLLAGEGDRVRLPSDPNRRVRGVDVLPWVLSPLMGPEEYEMDEMDKLPETLQFLPPTKTRERDTVLRMMCVEILLLLATTFTGRQTLRDRGTYFVVREAHKNESDQQIKDAIERLVGLLEGEEGHESKVDELEHLERAKADAAAKKAEASIEELDVVEV